MNRQRSVLRRALVALSLFGFVAAPAFAGGPLANCESGQPFLWPGGGVGIPFNPDQGALGPLNHAQAVAAVQDAFDTWAAVPTSTVTYLAGAELPVNVDVTNFGPFLDPVAPDGLSAIVFDDDGAIFNLLFGAGSGVLGFAGPEWVDFSTCTILEGVSFLNGPSFTDLTAAKDVMVHEFGHYTNLAHSAVNGQIFLAGDASGPTPSNTFGNPAAITVIETMYPFYFGPTSGTQTLQADDAAMVSTLYPEPGFAGASGSIRGTILRSNGTTKLSGVNVIARNVADPFLDAVSAISGDFTDAAAQSDPFTGVHRVNGLTPGASYAVYVDQILAGGFSTAPALLPGPEEFHSGAAESNNVATPDDPSVFAPVASVAGTITMGVDVIMNSPRPGDPLAVGDDGFVELSLPFPFKVCGQEFEAVFVNGNGNLSFGAGSSDFTETVPEFLAGPPRIAGVWDDLNAAGGGVVTFDQTANSFTALWEAVPEFPNTGANTFRITLKRAANHATVDYGDLTATDGLAGLSCGGLQVTSGFENEQDLRRGLGHRSTVNLNKETAAFEIFTEADSDLADFELTFVNFKGGLDDEFEPNDDVAHAERIHFPFDTASSRNLTKVDPVGGDVDFFRFSVKAGDFVALEVVRGGFDSVLGVFDTDTGTLLAVNDDGGAGLLSRLLLQVNVDLNLAVAVSAFPDLDLTGDGGEGGRYVLTVNRYRGELVAAGDDTTTEVPTGFPFRFQGQNWDSVFVNSNGNLTFGAGDADFTESVAELLAGAPRIAPLWDDLNAAGGLVVADRTDHSLSIHYVSVPEFASDSPNYFTVHLLPLGLFLVDYQATARSDSLVAVTEGGGAADPGEADISDRRLPVFSGRGTLYEQFIAPDPFDLSFVSLLFLPF